MKPLPTNKDLEVNDKLIALDAIYSTLPFSPDNFRSAIVDYANAFEGIREIGNTNTGYWINKFAKDIKLAPGNPWCLSFIQYFLKHISIILETPDVLPYDTAGTQALAAWGKKENKLISDISQLRVGDLLIWRNGKNSTLGHVGLAIAIDDNYVYTIEGNTSDSNYRDGGLVAKKKYKLSSFQNITSLNIDKRHIRCIISLDLLFPDLTLQTK